MADSDIWNPRPVISMKFSQYPPGSRDVLLTYSTDTEKADPKKAREQASILAEQHFGNIPKHLRVVKRKFYEISKKPPARCALINEHSILIRDAGTIAPQEHDTRRQCLTSISSLDSSLLMRYILRLHPHRHLKKVESEAGVWQFRIETQIDFDDWEDSVGDPEPRGRTTFSAKS